MNISPANSLALWTKAHPMNGARLGFTPTELRERWKKSKEVSAIDVFKETAKSSAENGVTGWDAFNAALKDSTVITGERDKIIGECEKLLLHHIETGTLQSYAFETPRTLESKPVKLPSRVWKGRLDGHSNKIVHESLSFIEVRLVSTQKAKTFLTANLKMIPRPQRPAIGRPGVRADIEEAFFALMEAGKFDLDAPVKSQCQSIRSWLIHFKPSGGFGPDKPGYDAIRRHLQPLISNHKQG